MSNNPLNNDHSFTLTSDFIRFPTKRLSEMIRDMKPVPVRSEKISRNEKCLCGSGKKYKNCCNK